MSDTATACSNPHHVSTKVLHAEMREAALQAAADANGGYIGSKIKRIANAAISSVLDERRADPRTGTPVGGGS